MKFKKIIAGYSHDITNTFYVQVPDGWSDSKTIKKFSKSNQELNVYNISSVPREEITGKTVEILE